jgi:hypothetical protein
MLTRYKNVLLKIIVESGLDISQFDGKEQIFYELDEKGKPVERDAFVIEVKGSPLKFTVINDPESYHFFLIRCIEFTPAFEERKFLVHPWYDDKQLVDKSHSIDELEKNLTDWLSNHVKVYLEDVTLPDLWSQIENITLAGILPAIPGRDTSDFSGVEKVQIRIAMQNFQQAIIQDFGPSEKQMEDISHQLKYLSDAVNRLNRFDWRALALSTVLSIAVTLSVDTQTGRVLLNMLQQALQSAIHLIP